MGSKKDEEKIYEVNGHYGSAGVSKIFLKYAKKLFMYIM